MKRKILIIDDDADLSMIVQEVVEGQNVIIVKGINKEKVGGLWL